MNDQKTKIIMIKVVLISILLFSVNANAQIKKLSNPLFSSDIVEIPHETVVVEVNGIINILKYKQNQEGYKALKVGEHIEENDMIEVYPNATVVFGSGDSTAKSKKPNDTRYFTFKIQ